MAKSATSDPLAAAIGDAEAFIQAREAEAETIHQRLRQVIDQRSQIEAQLAALEQQRQATYVGAARDATDPTTALAAITKQQIELEPQLRDLSAFRDAIAAEHNAAHARIGEAREELRRLQAEAALREEAAEREQLAAAAELYERAFASYARTVRKAHALGALPGLALLADMRAEIRSSALTWPDGDADPFRIRLPRPGVHRYQ